MTRRLGPYRLLETIGSGGMGRVWRAEVVEDTPGPPRGSVVALKVVHTHLLETPGFFQRFLREADVGRAVQHENVVRTYLADAVLQDGVQQNFLVMEYVDGQTLRDLLAELGRVPEELSRHIGVEVARGLEAIHAAGVVHRDLKPDNVLITKDHVVKVMDLGVAQLRDEAIRLSHTGGFVGSLEYAAPEQFRAAAVLDGRTDLHALGTVLFELSTGERPYLGGDASDVMRRVLEEVPPRVGRLNPQLSAFFEEVVHTLLAKQPDQRFEDAATLARVLEEGEAGTWWKGRSQDLRRETRRPLRRVRVPRETALYGRDDELALLQAAYDRARAGEGQVVLIEGEAGIGKSRLVDAFVANLVDGGEDLNFLFGAYPPGGAATEEGALSTAYREHLGVHGLEQTLRHYLAQTPALVPAFAAVLRGDAMPADQELLTKASLQSVFVHTTRALASERPTVVLIDDLHFAPEEGRALFAALALAVPGHRVLLIGSSRPGLPEEWAANLGRHEHTTCLTLHRLGAKDLARLLKETFRSERLARELGLKIAEMSDGNPFFVFEIIQGLRDARFVTQTEDGSWIGMRTTESIPVPSSVQDILRARVAELDEQDRELLDVAACCGYEFDVRVVAGVVGRGLVPCLRSMARLERHHRLVRSVGPRFVFDHHQVQEGLYAALPDLLAREYHAGIGDAFAALVPEGGDGTPVLPGAAAVELCQHYLRGGRGQDAVRHLGTALDHLEAGYLHAPAVELATLALDVPGLLEGAARAQVLLRQTHRLHQLAIRPREEEAVEEALEIARRLDRLDLEADAWCARGHLHMATARYEEARQDFAEGLARAEASGDARRMAHAVSAQGAACQALAHREEARDLLRRGLELAQAAGDRVTEASVEGTLGLLNLAASAYDEARRHLQRQIELATELGSPRTQAFAMGNLGIVCQEQGQLEEARALFARKLEVSREVGDREGEAVATANLGMVHVSLGQYEEARAQYEQTRALAREIGAADGEAHAEGNLGVVCFDLCRYAEARDHYRRQIEIVRDIHDPYIEGHALANLARLEAVLGQRDRSRETIEAALRLLDDVPMPRVEGYARHALAVLAEEAGDVDEAARLYEQALAVQRGIGAQEAVAETLVSLGRLEADRGAVAKAAELLDEAARLGAEVDAPGSRCLASVHRAALPGGDVEAARETMGALAPRLGPAVRMQAWWALYRATGDAQAVRRARALLDRAVEAAPPECRDAMVRHVALHRAILSAA